MRILWEFPNVEIDPGRSSSGRQSAPYSGKSGWSRLTSAATIQEPDHKIASAAEQLGLKPCKSPALHGKTFHHALSHHVGSVSCESRRGELYESPFKTAEVGARGTRPSGNWRLENPGPNAPTGFHRRSQKTGQFGRQTYLIQPMIYFDYNATAPVMREAREAWLNATEKIAGNPSSLHQFGAAGRTGHDRCARKTRRLPRLPSGRTSSGPAARPRRTTWSCTISPRHSIRRPKSGFPPSNIRASWNRRSIISATRATELIPVTRDGVIDLDWLTVELADVASRTCRRHGGEQRNRRHSAVARGAGHLPAIRSAVLLRRRPMARQNARERIG